MTPAQMAGNNSRDWEGLRKFASETVWRFLVFLITFPT